MICRRRVIDVFSIFIRYAPNSLNLFYAFDGNKNVSDVFYRMNSNGIGAYFSAATRASAFFDVNPLILGFLWAVKAAFRGGMCGYKLRGM